MVFPDLAVYVHLVGILVNGVICGMVVSVVVVHGVVVCGAVWVVEGTRVCCGFLVCICGIVVGVWVYRVLVCRWESWVSGVERRGGGMKVVPVALAVPVLRVGVAVNSEGSQSDGALFRVLGARAAPVFVEVHGVVVGLVVIVVAVEVSLNVVLCVV